MVSLEMVSEIGSPTIQTMTLTVAPDGTTTNRARMIRADGTVRDHDKTVVLRSEEGRLFEVAPETVSPEVEEVVRYALREGLLYFDAETYRLADAEPRQPTERLSIVLQRVDADAAALLGSWACHEGTDPVITFLFEQGEPFFASYLHERPSLSGTWQTQDGTLRIQAQGGLTYLFSSITIEGEELVLEGPDDRWACTRTDS